MKGLTDIARFEVNVSDYVAVVTMQSPPVNAQDRRFRDECVKVFDVLSASDEVRAVVLTGGGGRAFSAGADLSERAALSEEPGGYSRHNRLVRASFDAVLECTKPVIAAVNGAAVGGGCVLALVCDILVVAEEAFLSMTEVDYGLAGGARHLLRSFSPSDARLAIFTARRLTGPELYRMNVASLCVPRAKLMDEAMTIAGQITTKAPLAVQAAKRAFGLTEEMPLRDGYRYEQTQTAALANSEDTQEALRAFGEKRPPVFKGR